MQYTQGNIGRIFVARLDDEEDLLEGLKTIIKQEKVKTGVVYVIGALSSAKAVLGPHKKEYPPNPFWWEFDDAKEIIGIGMFAWEDNEPKIHLHAGIGNSCESKTGCIRDKANIYITVEAVIQEFINLEVTRELDSRYNASLLHIK